MNDTMKPPAAFDAIPVGGPAALLDIPRAAPPAAPPVRPVPRQTMPLPPMPEPPKVAPLPVGIAPEAPVALDANPMAGSPPPKASIFSGLLWDLLRPNRAKVAVLAGLGSLAAGAFGLNLLVPQFNTPPQQQAKAKESPKPATPDAPPVAPPVAPAPLPKPAEGGWNPIGDITPVDRRPKPAADHGGPTLPGGLVLPTLPIEDPNARRVSHEAPVTPAPLTTPAPLPAPGGLPPLAAAGGWPPEPAVTVPPALPGVGPKPPELPTPLPLPPLPGAETPKPAEPVKPFPLLVPTSDKKPLPEVKPLEVKPLTFPGGDLPPTLPGLPPALPALPPVLPQPEVKPQPSLPLPGLPGLPGATELQPLDTPPLPGAAPKLEPVKPLDAKPAQPELFPGTPLPKLEPIKAEPVIGVGAIGTPPAPPPAALPTPGPAAVLQPPLSEAKTDFDLDIHRPRAGDTYATVSKSFYGDSQYAAALQAFNRNLPITRVAEVQVPPVHVIRKYGTGAAVEPRAERGDPIPSRPAPAGGDEPMWGPPGAAQAGQVVYTPFKVPRKGMTLRDVAKVFYGSEANWSRLNNARNPKYDPDEELPAGTQLYVPTELLPLR